MKIKSAKKGWFKNYWTKINVTILPTDMVVKENQKKLSIDSNHMANEDLIERMNQQRPNNTVEHFSPKNSGMIHNQLASTIEPAHVETVYVEQPSFHFIQQNEMVLSPEIMKETIQSLNMSIRQTAEEIGIAHTTLSRYLRKERAATRFIILNRSSSR